MKEFQSNPNQAKRRKSVITERKIALSNYHNKLMRPNIAEALHRKYRTFLSLFLSVLDDGFCVFPKLHLMYALPFYGSSKNSIIYNTKGGSFFDYIRNISQKYVQNDFQSTSITFKKSGSSTAPPASLIFPAKKTYYEKEKYFGSIYKSIHHIRMPTELNLKRIKISDSSRQGLTIANHMFQQIHIQQPNQLRKNPESSLSVHTMDQEREDQSIVKSTFDTLGSRHTSDLHKPIDLNHKIKNQSPIKRKDGGVGLVHGGPTLGTHQMPLPVEAVGSSNLNESSIRAKPLGISNLRETEASLPQKEINRVAEEVCTIIEKKIRTESERRGVFS
jgi:hypothetical protein